MNKKHRNEQKQPETDRKKVLIFGVEEKNAIANGQ